MSYMLLVVNYFILEVQNSIKARRTQHKQRAHKCPDNEMYKKLNEIGWDKLKLKVIEEFPFTTTNDLKERENYYIKKYCKSQHAK